MSARSCSMLLRVERSASPPISAMTTREAAGACAVSALKRIRSVEPVASGVMVKMVVYSVPPFSATIRVAPGGSDSTTIISSVALIPNILRVSRHRSPGSYGLLVRISTLITPLSVRGAPGMSVRTSHTTSGSAAMCRERSICMARASRSTRSGRGRRTRGALRPAGRRAHKICPPDRRAHHIRPPESASRSGPAGRIAIGRADRGRRLGPGPGAGAGGGAPSTRTGAGRHRNALRRHPPRRVDAGAGAVGGGRAGVEEALASGRTGVDEAGEGADEDVDHVGNGTHWEPLSLFRDTVRVTSYVVSPCGTRLQAPA